jgi:protein-L-isoaspartate(D-aspartate) O-methyltransferase
MTDYAIPRANMVENQLRPSRIEDERLLLAMGSVPRELFVPAGLRGVAYADEDIPLGGGRFLVEPLALAKLIQAAEITNDDKVLVIGDASGYAAAVAAQLAGAVTLLLPPGVATEPIRERLQAAGAEGVSVETGEDPRAGRPEAGPCDVILVVGAVTAMPPALLAQLAEQGRLAAVLGDGRGGRVAVTRRHGNSFATATPFDAAMPAAPGMEPPAGFVF